MSTPHMSLKYMDRGMHILKRPVQEGISAVQQRSVMSLHARRGRSFRVMAEFPREPRAQLLQAAYVENSKGLSLYDSWASSYVSSSVIVKDGEDVKNAFHAIEGDIGKADMRPAVDKALKRLSASTLASGPRPVIFNPDCFNMFLSTFSSAFSGKNALLGLSPYGDKVGDMVASPCVTLVDDPLYPDYPAQRTFDGDAYATYTKTVIEDGVLKTLLYNRQWALKAGCRTTGNALSTASGSAICPYSFYIAPSSCSFDELVAKAGEGLYITAMKGFHAGADAVSGDFSIESSGFIISHGKVEGPVQGFTVAGNFFQMVPEALRFSSLVSPLPESSEKGVSTVLILLTLYAKSRELSQQTML